MRHPLFVVAYALSGVAALVYQVTWSRLFALTLGHSLGASSTVLAAYMAGLAAGALAAGRLAPRLTAIRALRAYAALEIAVAVIAIGLPAASGTLTPILAWAYADASGGALFGFVRFTGGFTLLLAPTLALGATFPLGARWFVDQGTAGRSSSAIYAANTAGAALGALLAGFLLLPSFGLTMTTMTGAACSMAAAAIALALAARSGPSRDTTTPTSPRADTPPIAMPAVVVSLTGFAGFVLEICWMRVFAMTAGPSTYAFAATVALFIAGLAAGAAVSTPIAARTKRPAAMLAAVLALAAAVTTWATWQAGVSLPERFSEIAAAAGSFDEALRRMTLAMASTLLPPAFSLGLAWPLAAEIAGSRTAQAPRRGGLMLAANTAGAVAGSLAAGHVLIPSLGLEATMKVASAALTTGAVVVIAGSLPGRDRLLAAVATAAAAALIAWPHPWDRALLASGPYKYMPRGGDRVRESAAALRAGDLVFYEEGATGTVSVKRLHGTTMLAIDGKVDASTSSDMLTQKTLAHLPLLVHGSARTAAIVGLGSGVTLAAALTHPLDAVDVVELSPDVVAASRHFATENRGALDDPRVRLVLNDGRTHLQLGRGRFDVIVSEPSNPWMAGVASLFTTEFFELARRRLAPGGILCQWMHTYDISEAALQSIVGTVTDVFPHVSMWLVGDGDLLLLASDASLDDRLGHVSDGWARGAVAEDLATIGASTPFALLSLYAGGTAAARAYGAGARRHADDDTAIEFSGPAALFDRGGADPAAALRRIQVAMTPPPGVAQAIAAATAGDWQSRADMLMRAAAATPAYGDYQRALARAPASLAAGRGLVDAALASGQANDARSWLRERLIAQETPALWVALSRLDAASGNGDRALQAALEACRFVPAEVSAFEQLASIHADRGDAARLAPVVDAMLRLFPESAGAAYYAGALAFMEARLEEAREWARRANLRDASRADAINLRGAVLARQGHVGAARAAFTEALRVSPRDVTGYTNFGLLELSGGNRDAAARLFAQALALDPTSEAARQGLRETLPASR